MSSDVLDRLVRFAQFFGSVEFLVEREAEGYVTAPDACKAIRELVEKLNADMELNKEAQ